MVRRGALVIAGLGLVLVPLVVAYVFLVLLQPVHTVVPASYSAIDCGGLDAATCQNAVAMAASDVPSAKHPRGTAVVIVLVPRSTAPCPAGRVPVGDRCSKYPRFAIVEFVAADGSRSTVELSRRDSDHKLALTDQVPLTP